MRYIYSSKLIKGNDLYFPDIRRFQDVIFFLNVMSKSGQFYSIPETVYVYRGNNRVASFFTKEKSLAWMKGVNQGLVISHNNNWSKIHYDTLKILTYDNFLDATESLRGSFDEDYEKQFNDIISNVNIPLLTLQDYDLDMYYPKYGVLYNAYLWSVKHVVNEEKANYLKRIINHIGPLEFVKALIYNYIKDKTALVKIIDWLPHKTIKRRIKTIGIYNETMNVGGVERCISLFIPMFIKLGYNVVLFSDTPAEEDKFEIPNYVKRIIIPGRIPINKCDWMKRADVLSTAISENNVDLFYYHSYWKPDIIFDELICKLVCGIPFLLHHHNVFSAMLSRGNNIFDNAISLYSFSDLIISLSTVDQLYFRLNK